jgi:hypothetical protein
MALSIITNWARRPLVSVADLPVKAAADFDYIKEDERFTPRIVNYRGSWFDVFDTQRIEPDSDRAHPMGWAMRVHPGSPLCLFDSIISDTYFSGMLFKLADDESVIVARFYS